MSEVTSGAVEFQRLTPERPSPSLQVALIFERMHRRVLLVDARHEATEVWALEKAGFTRIASGLLPAPSDEVRNLGPPVAWTDPTTGEAVIGRIAVDGLRTVRLAAPSEVSFHPHAFDAWVSEAHGLFHPKLGVPVVLVCGGNDATIFAVRPNELVSLGKAPYLLAFALVEDAGVPMGYEVGGTLFLFDGSDFVEVGSARGLQGLAWHRTLETIVSLRPTRDGTEGMILSAWMEQGEEGFEDVEPEVRASTYRSGGRLVMTDDLRVVYFGGQDFDKGGDPTNASLISEPGGTVLRSDDVALPTIGRYTSAITTATRFVLADHSSMAIVTPKPPAPTEFEEIAVRAGATDKSGPALDDRYINFAASDDRVFLLDREGSLWSAERGAAFARVAPAHPGPGGHYSHRVAMAWDEPARALVVFGGIESNSTWLWEDGATCFVELRPPSPPPHGVASIVSTPRGAYLLSAGELYRFFDRAWHCVATDLPGHRLFFDPKRERLFVGGYDREARVHALFVVEEGGATRSVARLPPDASFGTVDSQDDVIGIDGMLDRLLIFGPRDAWTLPLASIPGGGGLPQSRISPKKARRATAPPEWTRRAAHLVIDREVPLPKFDVVGDLVAILPAHPEAMPLPSGYVALAISEEANWMENGARPWELGGGGYHARLLRRGEFDHDAGFALIVDGPRCARVKVEPYSELDPAHVEEVDTPPGRIDTWSWYSKLGGFPRFLQDDPTEAWTGPPLRFAAQLTTALRQFDVGKLYVWIADEGAEGPQAYVVKQS